MINRNEYLQKLINLKDKNLIKVVTGIRRSGKSTLFQIFKNYLSNEGIEPQRMISINFEDIDFENLLDRKLLYSYIKDRLVPGKMNYVFLDEIQNVYEFEKVIDSLYIQDNVDLYVTGSNACLLSGEIATLLSGRYIEIKMLPLSFKEYISTFQETENLNRRYGDYLVTSSFPYAVQLQGNKELLNDYLRGIYNTVVLKDIVARKNISDVFMLESVIRFMFDNIGNLISIKKISDTMTSSGRKISTHTVENYLSALCDSYVLNRVTRFDIKGKQYLKTGEKYYLTDIGLRYMLLGSKIIDYGHILENIVYLELLRRGYDIFIGKVGATEVDFITYKNGVTEYFQVAQTVSNPETLERELRPLSAISDHSQKTLLTLDETPVAFHEGIKQMNALDWLLEQLTKLNI